MVSAGEKTKSRNGAQIDSLREFDDGNLLVSLVNKS